MACKLKKPWAFAPMAFALFQATKTWVQASKVIKIKKDAGEESLHGREIKKENGFIVKKNRLLARFRGNRSRDTECAPKGRS
ncbi:MAG TPA: hypothetical protein VMT62_18025 [Syntrophorhabdaceae bacterium]|nr:hypothetical protein [Syntrophorhabdaceae bacterium]